MSDDRKTISLKYPIPIPKEGGGTMMVSQLSIGRFKVKHLKLLPKSLLEAKGKIQAHELVPIIAGLADIPVESAEEMDMEDMIKISNEMESFFAESLPTGGKSAGE